MRADVGTGSYEWPPTDWSALGRAGKADNAEPEILNSLILQYRAPLLEYLACAFPSVKNRAEEILQDFSEDRLLREGWLAKADRNRGRFRDLLKRSLKNYARDYLRRQAKSPASLDELELDPPEEAKGTAAFDLCWAKIVLAETLRRMEEDCRAPGKEQPRRSQIWEVFYGRVLAPILEGAQPMSYDEVVARFAINSPGEAHNMLATAKRIFARHLQGVIQDYDNSGSAVEAELAELKAFLNGLSAGHNTRKHFT